MIDLSVNLAGIHLANPTILASGILGLKSDLMERVAASGAAAVTLKSLTAEPRKGHNNPIIVEFETGVMNAVGYANDGIDAGVIEFKKWNGVVPLIGSIVGKDAAEFGELAEKISEAPIAALEIVLSCPHTPGYGLLAGQGTPEATSEITRAVVAKTKAPVFVKISPSVPGIGDIAKAAEAEGAAAINMGNTVGPGMKIDLARRAPILDFKFGGMSGPAIKPLTIRSVWDIYQAVKIPVIAVGGLQTGEDAIEAILAGATAIGIGTGIHYRGMDVFKLVCDEMTAWMEKNGVKTLSELKGKAHEA